MRLEYQISEADFMAAYEAFWRSRKLGTKRNLVEAFVAVLAGIAFVCFGQWFGYVLGGVGLVMLAFTFIRRFLHRQAYFDSPKFVEPIVAEFKDDGIDTSSAVGESRLEWSIFESVLEADDYFLPMITKRSFSIVPKRAFASPADEETFRELLAEKVGGVRRIS